MDVLRKIFPQQNVIETESVAFLQTFLDSGCQVLAGEQNDISDILARNKGYEGEYTYGEKVLSKEPLGKLWKSSLSNIHGCHTFSSTSNEISHTISHGDSQERPKLD